jgi:MFS family permease
MVIMDTSIIGVALPDIQADLGFGPENLSWVFNAYVVALGGVITEWISWPWVFYINVPIAVLVLAITPGLMPTVVRAPEQGWGSAATLLTIAGGLGLLALFVAVQAGRREPLMRLSILRTPNLAAANLAQLLLGAAWIPMWFFLNLYLQQVLGYGAFEGGAALLPMTVAITIGMVLVAPRVIARFGTKTPIVAGMLLLAAGMAITSLVRPDGGYRWRARGGSHQPPRPRCPPRSRTGLPRGGGAVTAGRATDHRAAGHRLVLRVSYGRVHAARPRRRCADERVWT